MPSDLASYLADHYLTADPKPSKKRKRKQGDSKKSKQSAGLVIQDDDDDAVWTKPSTRDADADETGGPAMVAGTSAEFRRATKSSWKTLGGGGSKNNNSGTDQEAAAADAILASAAAENAAARAAEDDAPVVDGAAVKMSDGTHAGLQTAATVAAQLQRRRAEEKAQYERERAERRAARGAGGGGGDSSGEEETVFRDATGRRIDVTLQREQKRRAEAEKERAAKEALKGEVQIKEARRRREKLEDAALEPLARGKDDEEMNSALKSEQRWNDPMMQFMSESDKREAGSTVKAGNRRVKGRPVYQGPAGPNRYGIRPGYRWDGVDRGNGFEAERFKALNRRERAKDLEYNWQMDE